VPKTIKKKKKLSSQQKDTKTVRGSKIQNLVGYCHSCQSDLACYGQQERSVYDAVSALQQR
jgi:hypothetical protein